MSESELGRALVACDGTPSNDARKTIERVLKRDRWQVRLLATLTMGLWLLAAAYISLWIFLWFTAMQPRLMAKAEDHATVDDRVAWVQIGQWAAKSVAAVTAATLSAAIATVWLVFASRRATLRQVNMQLAEISEQLRQLQQALAKPPSPAGEPGA